MNPTAVEGKPDFKVWNVFTHGTSVWSRERPSLKEISDFFAWNLRLAHIWAGGGGGGGSKDYRDYSLWQDGMPDSSFSSKFLFVQTSQPSTALWALVCTLITSWRDGPWTLNRGFQARPSLWQRNAPGLALTVDKRSLMMFIAARPIQSRWGKVLSKLGWSSPRRRGGCIVRDGWSPSKEEKTGRSNSQSDPGSVEDALLSQWAVTICHHLSPWA